MFLNGGQVAAAPACGAALHGKLKSMTLRRNKGESPPFIEDAPDATKPADQGIIVVPDLNASALDTDPHGVAALRAVIGAPKREPLGQDAMRAAEAAAEFRAVRRRARLARGASVGCLIR